MIPIEDAVHSKAQVVLPKALFLVIWEMLSNNVVIDETLMMHPQLRADSKPAEPRGRQGFSQTPREAAFTALSICR